ncbi:MAG: signal peptidase II [Proteobacteria bacterium]|nr:signal peptidase II [Pseudomonadota bacterium]
MATKQSKKISGKHIKRNPAFALFIAIIVILIDQATKALVGGMVTSGDQIAPLPFLNIATTWNYGVSFGLGNDAAQDQMPIALLSLMIVVALWMLILKQRYMSKLNQSAIAMIIGGALSNLIDRWNYGAVMDFLDFHIMGYHWPAFNVADSAIVVGVIIWLIFTKDT